MFVKASLVVMVGKKLQYTGILCFFYFVNMNFEQKSRFVTDANPKNSGFSASMGPEIETFLQIFKRWIQYIGILFPKLFFPTVRKKCSSDGEKLFKFKAEGLEFAKFLRLLEQFIQTVKGQNNFL